MGESSHLFNDSKIFTTHNNRATKFMSSVKVITLKCLNENLMRSRHRLETTILTIFIYLSFLIWVIIFCHFGDLGYFIEQTG